MRTFQWTSHPRNLNIGILLIRLGIGIIFMMHGYLKLMAGKVFLHTLGESMKLIGITFAPLAWGHAAALSELIGGLCLVLGLGTRFAVFFISCVMIVALVTHLNAGDAWVVYSYPLTMLIIMIGLMISGGGAFSLDAWIHSRK